MHHNCCNEGFSQACGKADQGIVEEGRLYDLDLVRPLRNICWVDPSMRCIPAIATISSIPLYCLSKDSCENLKEQYSYTYFIQQLYNTSRLL